MLIPSDAFILPYFNEIDALLQNYVYNGYQALMGYIRAPLGVLVLLAIGFSGYRTWTNVGGELKLSDFFAFLFKVSFIYFFAINWGHFSELVMGLFNDGVINGMGAALLQANPIHIAGVTNVEAALQLQSQLMDEISRQIFGAGSWHNWTPYIYATITWVTTTIMIAIIVIEMTLAKVMMALLFVLAPAMIPCVMFEKTRSIFTSWLGNLVGYSLLLVFINALMGLLSGIVMWIMPIRTVTEHLPLQGTAMGIAPFLIVTCVVIYAVTKVHSMAMQIGSGVSSGGSGAGFMMGIIGGLGTSKMLGSMAMGPVGMVAGAGSKTFSKAGSALKNRASNIGQRLGQRMRKGD